MTDGPQKIARVLAVVALLICLAAAFLIEGAARWLILLAGLMPVIFAFLILPAVSGKN